MGSSNNPVTLTPEQVEDFFIRLSDLRHNVNNNLALVVASVELIKRKPDMINTLSEKLCSQPEKIIKEIRDFSDYVDAVLKP